VAVSLDFRIEIRPYSGYEDPGLPVASWITQGGIAGDASGGTMSMNFLFELEGGVRISELFNVERMALDTINNSARVFMLTTLNMDNLAPTRQASPQKWQFSTIPASPLGSALPPEAMSGFPLWLGAPANISPAGDKGLRLQASNVNGELYAVTFQGYMWGPRAVLAPGGPRRPVEGFLGR